MHSGSLRCSSQFATSIWPSLSGTAQTGCFFRHHLQKQDATIDKHAGDAELVEELGRPPAPKCARERRAASAKPNPYTSRLMPDLGVIEWGDRPDGASPPCWRFGVGILLLVMALCPASPARLRKAPLRGQQQVAY